MFLLFCSANKPQWTRHVVGVVLDEGVYKCASLKPDTVMLVCRLKVWIVLILNLAHKVFLDGSNGEDVVGLYAAADNLHANTRVPLDDLVV